MTNADAREAKHYAEECFAVRGHTMIDTINPATGRTHIYGKTLEEVRTEGVKPWADYTQAERMTVNEYCLSKAAQQDTQITWEPSTEEAFWEALECVPPAYRRGNAFLIGEPYDHHALSGAPRHSAYKQIGELFYHSSRPMTLAEFKKEI